MKKNLKAWAIFLDGQLAHYDDGHVYSFAKTKKEAMRYLDTRAGYSMRRITIEYEKETTRK